MFVVLIVGIGANENRGIILELFTVKMPSSFNLYQLGDGHEGTIAQARTSLLNGIKLIKNDPIGYAVHVGDECEGRAIDDPRYDSDVNTTPVPFRQAEQVIEDFSPIKKKIIVWLEGNHNLYAKKYVHITKHICRELDIPFGTWSSKVNYTDRKGASYFKAFYVHGAQMSGPTRSRAGTPSRRSFNESESLKNLLYPACDDVLYYGCGHYHRQILYSPEMGKELLLRDDGREIKQEWSQVGDGPDTKFYACSGAFVKQFIIGASTYAERNLYRPVDIGMIKTVVKNGVIKEVVKIAL